MIYLLAILWFASGFFLVTLAWEFGQHGVIGTIEKLVTLFKARNK